MRTRPLRGVELLEDRVLLSITPTWDGSGQVTFTANSADDHLYLRTDVAGRLEWSENGSDFSDIQHGAETLTFVPGGSVTVQVEPDDIGSHVNVVLQHIDTLGSNLTVMASDQTITAASVVSTRQVGIGLDHETADSAGDSGALHLEANTINVLPDGALLAHVLAGDTANKAGDVTLIATDTSWSWLAIVPVVDIASSTATVTMNGAIRGAEVEIKALADSADLWDGGLVESAVDFFSGLSLLGGWARSTADADVMINGGLIDADTLTIDATANAATSLKTVSVFLAVAVATTTPEATVEIQGGADIHVAGGMTVKTTADSNTEVSAVQSLLGVSNVAEKVNVTVAISDARPKSIARIDNAHVDVGGDLELTASAHRDASVTSKAAAFSDGSLGTAVAVALGETQVEASIEGTSSTSVIADGNVTISASSTTDRNDTAVGSQVGSSALNKALGRASNKVNFFILSDLFQKLAGGLGMGGVSKQEFSNLKQSSGGLSAGWLWAQYTTNATACIGAGTTVRSLLGSIDVLATITEIPENSAITSVISNPGTMNTRKVGISGAITVGLFTNNAEAYIGADATVTALHDVTVTSETEFPYDIQWHAIQGISDITDKLNLNLGVQNGLVTSWAEANTQGAKGAYGGTVNVLRLDNNSRAHIDEGARVTLDGALTVLAHGENETVSVTGPALHKSLLAKGTTAGDVGVGGSTSWIRYDNVVHARIYAGAEISCGTLLVFADTPGPEYQRHRAGWGRGHTRLQRCVRQVDGHELDQGHHR